MGNRRAATKSQAFEQLAKIRFLIYFITREDANVLSPYTLKRMTKS